MFVIVCIKTDEEKFEKTEGKRLTIYHSNRSKVVSHCDIFSWLFIFTPPLIL